jgi:hypothetical protein
MPALRLLATALLAVVPSVRAAQCGTALLFERAHRLGIPAASLAPLRKSAFQEDGYRPRTLVSENFLIHYSLRSWHRVHTEAADSVLVRVSDSLYSAYASLGVDARDSAVYARLDSLGIPHPIYVQKLREHFEAARAYYVGKLGMKAPSSNVLSVHYNPPANLPRKFPIDVVDLGTADPEYAGEIYAITYPPNTLSVTFENDFLFNTSLDDQGRIHGSGISSRLDGKVLHDYSKEWELGIKVTAYHEFYHAVQFTYVPHPADYHTWYELSATGMEERNAGEVDDYLQYLPCVLRNHDKVSLLSSSSPACNHSPSYGHAIFHQYLTRALDSTFDVKVWEQLGRNGDVLKDALETTFARYGKDTQTLYSEYAAEDFFAGKRFAFPPDSVWSTGGLYSSDFPKWPGIAYDSIDLEKNPFRVTSLPNLTFGVLKVIWGKSAVARVLQAKVAAGLTRIHADSDTVIIERLGETQVTLGPPRAGFDAYYLILPNPSFTEKATIEIKDPDAQFYAYPNPTRAASGALYFSQAKDMAFPARVRIYGESGRLLRDMSFATANLSIAWDLKDAQNRTVKPGVYYYRLDEQPLKPFVVLR